MQQVTVSLNIHAGCFIPTSSSDERNHVIMMPTGVYAKVRHTITLITSQTLGYIILQPYNDNKKYPRICSFTRGQNSLLSAFMRRYLFRYECFGNNSDVRRQGEL